MGEEKDNGSGEEIKINGGEQMGAGDDGSRDNESKQDATGTRFNGGPNHVKNSALTWDRSANKDNKILLDLDGPVPNVEFPSQDDDLQCLTFFLFSCLICVDYEFRLYNFLC